MSDPRPTICQLVHSLNVGGAEVLAARIGRKLQEQYRFVFACLDDLGPLGEELRADGFIVSTLGRHGLDFGCARRLAELIRREEIDLVHAHQYTPFFYATLSRQRVVRRFTVRWPIVFTEHGRFHPDYPRRKRMLYNRFALSSRDRVIAVGEAVRKALIDNEGFPPKRVEVVPNGIDLAAYAKPDPAARAEVRREFGVPDDVLLVAQVARLDPIKDHVTGIRAVSRLAGDGRPVRLLIVGDGPERTRIDEEIDRSGARHLVTLAGLRRDVPRILAGADAFLLTSVSEGIPLTVIEAMAAELPVVATDVGGLREIVAPDVTGFLARAGESDRIATCLARLAGDVALRRRLGAAGRQVAFQKFSEAAMIDAYEQVFAALAIPRASRSKERCS